MSDNIRSITFATILCLVCAVLLTAASSGLKELQLKNIAVDKNKNVLKAVGLLEEGQKYSSADIEKLYAQIGQLKVENDFLKKNCKKLGI